MSQRGRGGGGGDWAFGGVNFVNLCLLSASLNWATKIICGSPATLPSTSTVCFGISGKSCHSPRTLQSSKLFSMNNTPLVDHPGVPPTVSTSSLNRYKRRTLMRSRRSYTSPAFRFTNLKTSTIFTTSTPLLKSGTATARVTLTISLSKGWVVLKNPHQLPKDPQTLCLIPPSLLP